MMNRKTGIIVWMLVGGTIAANGQSISQEVLASAGEQFENGNTQLSWTLGETMIETYSDADLMLTQGFHQPELIITGLEETNPQHIEVNVFPNPTAEWLSIELYGRPCALNVQLTDIQGKVILQNRMKDEQVAMKLNMAGIAKAQYFLMISDENGSYTSSHKIVKN